MNRRNGRKPPKIHKDRLVPARPEVAALCAKVESQFKEMVNTYFRIRGEMIVPPSSLDHDMRRWRMMAVRFKQMDYRCSESEVKSMEAIAEWSYREYCKLRNQEPMV